MAKGLKDYIKWSSIISNIKMMRQVKKELSYLLVEGESDKKFFNNLIDKNSCKIEFIKGKDNVLCAMKQINSQGIKGVVAIVDSDFENILGNSSEGENIFTTDTHDIETLIVKTDTIDKILNEYSNIERVKSSESEWKTLLINKVVNVAAILGALRLVSIKEKLNLDFKNLNYNDFIDYNLEVDLSLLVRQVTYGSNRKSQITLIMEKLEAEIAKKHDVWQVSCGHDITNILAMVLSSVFGSNSLGNEGARYIDGTKLESALRVGYNYMRFYTTNIHKKILMYEQKVGWEFLQRHQEVAA